MEPEDLFSVLKSPPLLPVLTQMNSVHLRHPIRLRP
jgi:hypothetical protein